MLRQYIAIKFCFIDSVIHLYCEISDVALIDESCIHLKYTWVTFISIWSAKDGIWVFICL